MSFKNLAKTLHDAVLEETPESTHAAPAPAKAPALVHAEAAPPVGAAANVDVAVYGMLLEHTDFASTPLHKTIHKYIAAMSAAPLDEATKLKIAFTQAVQIDHITADGVRQAFAELKQGLTTECNKFSASMQGRNSHIQDTRQMADKLVEQITAKQKEIEVLGLQRTNLLAESEAETQRVAELTAQFQAALGRRTQELDKQLADLETVMR